MAALRARAWRIPHDLDAKGAVPVGLTTASEFGGPNLSIAKLNGITHNPWTHGRTAGGRRSSGRPARRATAVDQFASLPRSPDSSA